MAILLSPGFVEGEGSARRFERRRESDWGSLTRS
jgi:hypothetical protein